MDDEDPETVLIDDLLIMLVEKGYVGAAHEVSMFYWGYGMEDTDDQMILDQLEFDQGNAGAYVDAVSIP